MNFARICLIALAACLIVGQAEAKQKERAVVKHRPAKALKHRHTGAPKHTVERSQPRRPISGDIVDRGTGRIIPGGFATLTHRSDGLNLSIKFDTRNFDPSVSAKLGADANLFQATPQGFEAEALTTGDAKRIIKKLTPNAPTSKVDALVEETKTLPVGGGYSVSVK